MREGRDQHRAVHPDGVHRGHHVVARDLRRAGQDAGPGAARMVAFIGVHLRINDHHDVTSHEYGFFTRSLASAVHRIGGSVCKKPRVKPSRGFPEHAHRSRPGTIRYPVRWVPHAAQPVSDRHATPCALEPSTIMPLL